MARAPWRIALGVVTLLALPSRADAQPAGRPVAPGELRLTFLGTAGWEITDGRTVVVVDPFVSVARINAERVARGLPPRPTLADTLVPDAAGLEARVPRADYVLVTHGHADHALDATYLARRPGTVLVGHETTANLARAYGVPDSAIITVRGGEDYEFGAFSLRVIPNIHSALFDKRYYNSPLAGSAPRGLRGPLRLGDFVEGGNLAYLLRLAGHRVLIMGSMNYIEREMEGLRPTLALVGANAGRRQIHDYAGRLMRALGRPALVFPTHCCDAPEDPEARAFAEEVRAASPRTRVIVPRRFEPIVVPPPAR